MARQSHYPKSRRADTIDAEEFIAFADLRGPAELCTVTRRLHAIQSYRGIGYRRVAKGFPLSLLGSSRQVLRRIDELLNHRGDVGVRKVDLLGRVRHEIVV